MSGGRKFERFFNMTNFKTGKEVMLTATDITALTVDQLAEYLPQDPSILASRVNNDFSNNLMKPMPVTSSEEWPNNTDWDCDINPLKGRS